jgi:arylsulfatase A-like enzyme
MPVGMIVSDNLGRRLFVGFSAGVVGGGLDFLVRFLTHFNPALFENYRLFSLVVLASITPYIAVGVLIGFIYHFIKTLVPYAKRTYFRDPYVAILSIGITLAISAQVFYGLDSFIPFGRLTFLVIALIVITLFFCPAVYGISKVINILARFASKSNSAVKTVSAVMVLITLVPLTISSYSFLTEYLQGNDEPFICFLLIDALRADHLSCYGYERNTTPEIDTIAKDGVIFENCFSQSSWTRPSVSSILTGFPVTGHHVTTTLSKLPPDAYTLPEALKDAGYTTVGCSGTYVVSRRSNLDQGFDVFIDYERRGFLEACVPTIGSKVFDEIYTFYLSRVGRVVLNNKGEVAEGALFQYEQVVFILRFLNRNPVFVYIHTMEPHAPYAPSPRFRGSFGHFEGGPRTGDAPDTTSEEPLERTIQKYDCSVRQNDYAIGVFYGVLEEKGFLDNALMIITADHGEELRERGSLGHALTVYIESVHVPLIVMDTREKSPHYRYRGIVGLTDLTPTIIEWSDVSFPSDSASWFIGDSLFSLLDAKNQPEGKNRVIVSELYRDLRRKVKRNGKTGSEIIGSIKAVAIRDGTYSVVKDNVQGETYVFYLPEDPDELRPLETKPPEAIELEHELDAILNRYGKIRFGSEYIQEDEEFIRELEKLGYIR